MLAKLGGTRARMWPRLHGFPPVAPETPFCVAGDVHGEFDLLQRLLEQLDPGLPVVLTGDYIDRGGNSAPVLRFLAERPQYTCLMGNHEAMLLKFLDDPCSGAAAWLRHGGLRTLSSFEIRAPEADLSRAGLTDLRGRLEDAMGGELIGWLRGLPLWHRNGNVAVVHAGADPAQPVEGQSPRHLLWGHPDFTRKRRADGIWVVHGHTIVPKPEARHGRISVDTGAYATGCLSAAVITQGSVEFETACLG